MSKIVELTQGKTAIVDDADFERVRRWHWSATRVGRRWYAVRQSKRGGQPRRIQLHRSIFDVPANMEIEFIDGNGLNCTRENMRIVSREEHNWHRGKLAHTSSKYVGVNWAREKEKWCASIRVQGRLIHLGYFDDETEAARARDDAAKKYRGHGARLNFAIHG